jgi:hypothetical protein
MIVNLFLGYENLKNYFKNLINFFESEVKEPT